MKKALLIFLPIALAIIALSSFTTDYSEKDELFGVWVELGDKNGNTIYSRSEKFESGKAGISFQQDGQLIKRQKIGFCGSPITYGNHKGTWEITSDSTLSIRHGNWRGQIEQDWQIIELSDDQLTVKITGRKSN